VDPGTGLTILGSAVGRAKLVEKILGPTAEYLGNGIRTWRENRIRVSQTGVDRVQLSVVQVALHPSSTGRFGNLFVVGADTRHFGHHGVPRSGGVLGLAYMAPMGIYEFRLGLWLLVKGIRAPST